VLILLVSNSFILLNAGLAIPFIVFSFLYIYFLLLHIFIDFRLTVTKDTSDRLSQSPGGDSSSLTSVDSTHMPPYHVMHDHSVGSSCMFNPNGYSDRSDTEGLIPGDLNTRTRLIFT